MEEWQEIKFSDHLNIMIGGTPSRNNAKYWDANKEGDNLWTSIKDLNQSIILDTDEYISDEGVSKSNAKLIQKKTVLLSFKLTIGKVSIAGRPLYTNEAIAALIPKNDTLQNEFLFHGLKYWDLLQNVDNAIKGSTLNKKKIGDITVKIPISLKEQSLIATILSKVDEAIAKTEQLIAKYQRIKTGLMQDLLTKGIDEHGNIRSEETHAFQDSPLGRIPVEWDVMKLSDSCTHIVDCPHSTPKYLDSGVLVARTMQIKNGSYDITTSSFVSEEEYFERISRLEPRTGDIIFTREAPVGEAFIIPENMKICLGQRVMLIRLDSEKADPRFLLELIYSLDTRMRFDVLLGGTTNPHFNVKDVKNFCFKFPDIFEQQRIIKSISTIRSHVENEICRVKKLKNLKTGLMQDLLSGKVRVTELLTQAYETQIAE